jgi:hypothetical protein
LERDAYWHKICLYFRGGILTKGFQRHKGIISIVTISLLLFSQVALSMETSLNIIGDVVGKGVTEMKASTNRWISVSGKSFPILDGSNLRSKDGTMSVAFKDGVRLETGKNSDFIVNGSKGNYAITLAMGSIAFTVPQGVSFSVTTPNGTIMPQTSPHTIQKVSDTPQENVRGVVLYDSKGTKVMTVSGILMVKNVKGAGVQTVTAGNSLFIANEETERRIVPAQLAQPAPGAAAAAVIGPPTAIPPLVVVGGAALIIGGTALAVKSTTRGGQPVSPSKP